MVFFIGPHFSVVVMYITLRLGSGTELLLDPKCGKGATNSVTLTLVNTEGVTPILMTWSFSRMTTAANLVVQISNCATFGTPDPAFPLARMTFSCNTALQQYSITITDFNSTSDSGLWKGYFTFFTSTTPEHNQTLGTECGTTTSSTSTVIAITTPTSTHLVTPNTTSSTSTSTTTTATASISTSTTTTTSIKTSTRTTNSTVPTQIVTQSEQDDSITVVIVVPSVLGGLFVIGVAVTVALVWKFRKNQTLHSRSKHHKEGHSKKENKGRHLKRHPEYFEYIPSHHHGFSAKELYEYKMYSGQSEIRRNPLYSHHLDRHLNMSYVTNRGQYGYDQLYNGNQFLVYQMQSAGADPLYTRRGHMIHPEHRYQYSTNPRATTLRTQDNSIVTDYSWNWN